MLTEEIGFKGYFWLTETPETEISGEILFSPSEGVRLELFGDLHLGNQKSYKQPTYQNEPIIHGVSSNGEAISLIGCVQTKGIFHSGDYIGIPEVAYRVRYFFLGVFFPNPDEILFSKFNVRFTHLEDWFDYDPIQITNPQLINLQVQFKNFEAIKIPIDEFSITFSNSCGYKTPNSNDFVLSHKAWVQFSSTNCERGLDEYLNLMRRFQDFLTLGIGAPAYPIELEVQSNFNKKIIDEKEFLQPIKLYYSLPWKIIEKRRIYPFEMVFTLKTIKDNIGSILHLWFTNSGWLKPILDIYFSMVYRSEIYLEFRFIGMTQVIETYHRKKFGGKYTTDEDFMTNIYPNLIKALPTGLDADYKRSLKEGKLRYANEYSLGKRINQLTKHVTSFIPFNFLSDRKKSSLFSEEIRKTRNYLTHYDEKARVDVDVSGIKLFDLTKKLQAILEALLMEELGFTKEMILEIFKKKSEYSELLVQNDKFGSGR